MSESININLKLVIASIRSLKRRNCVLCCYATYQTELKRVVTYVMVQIDSVSVEKTDGVNEKSAVCLYTIRFRRKNELCERDRWYARTS